MLHCDREIPGRKHWKLRASCAVAALVIDTENAAQPLGRSLKLAEVLGAGYVTLEGLQQNDGLVIPLQGLPGVPG